MADTSTKLTPLPTRIDRYPAKMIAHLADKLIEQYARNADHVLDPFCGSGAVLRAARIRNIRTTGVDVNPFGVLLSGVKLEGFDKKRATDMCEEIAAASCSGDILPIEWAMKDYWFTPATLRKFEGLRLAASERQLHSTKAGRAVLLSLGLAARLCSRADQRSPKPFISRYARDRRAGRHFDPVFTVRQLLSELGDLYGGRPLVSGKVLHCDVGACRKIDGLDGRCSHVVTSPPYINAQDYFRNSKLELYLLEGLLPFAIEDIKNRFIGSERGLDASVLEDRDADARRRQVPQLGFLERNRREQAIVVHTYLKNMATAFRVIRNSMRPAGTLVIVCGDNLIGGKRILTWRILNEMLEELGFRLFHSFEDRIQNRALAPLRSGHKGLIKQEVVSAFRLNG